MQAQIVNCPQHKWLSLYHSWNVADYFPMKIRSCPIWRDEALKYLEYFQEAAHKVLRKSNKKFIDVFLL